MADLIKLWLPNPLRHGMDAILNGVAVAPIKNIGWLHITGEDRVRWLNGMVTNSVQGLKPGEGRYTFFLSAQGRIQADATIWMEDSYIVLQTAADRIPYLVEMLDRFIIMDDVELHPVASQETGLAIVGPGAGAALERLGCTLPEGDGLQRMEQGGASQDDLIKAYGPLVPRYELWTDDFYTKTTLSVLQNQGAAEVTPADLEALRILEGTPLFGTDIRDKDLPQETNQTRALHFSKGCYLGQEIVERIRSRGAVHRTFHGFILTGELPATGTPLYTTDPTRPVGEITSVARIGTSIYALGYIRREALETKADIHYTGGDAQPTSLPFPHPTT